MKILIYSDNHWCQYSSIVRKRGEKYSIRLENQIKSVSWAEQLATNAKCSLIVHCGDFFDSANLNAEEISALNEVKWNENIFHSFICGNHELGRNDLVYNSLKVLGLNNNIEVIDEHPVMVQVANTYLAFLPYILEPNRKSIKDYFPNVDKDNTIIFSHNDIKGIQMGPVISQEGFEIEDIENNCRLFINGHLHNGAKITDKIINIGNLTGQNFSEDATKYDHCAFVLDTDTDTIEVYENPYAFNFYKLDFTKGSMEILNTLKPNSVLAIKCYEQDIDTIKTYLTDNAEKLRVVDYRIILEHITELSEEDKEEIVQLTSVDHLKMFTEYVLENIANTEIARQELAEVLK